MFSSKKPYSSVTVFIERLTSEQYEEDDFSGIPDLVEAIKLQATGPAEAARALRKKLKYGNVHRQLRALTILDGLIQNAGARFQRAFIDEPLLERLRFCGTADVVDHEVKAKCKVLFAQWAHEYKKTPGLERIAGLYKEIPRRKQQVTQERSKVLKETERDPFEDAEDEDEAPPNPPAASGSPVTPVAPYHTIPTKTMPVVLGSSGHGFFDSGPKKSKKDKKGGKKKSKPFNLEEEKVKMKSAIAESSVASVNLLNSLKLINRENERVSENVQAAQRFETCKMLRRHILRYIQHVESEQWLGALIQANDNLVQALMTFEQLDRSIDADSDSEDEAAEQAHLYKMLSAKGKESEATNSLAGLSLNTPPVSSSPPRPAVSPRPTQPPRPAAMAVAPKPAPEPESEQETPLDEDDNDPFGDSNAVPATPAAEIAEPTWRVV